MNTALRKTALAAAVAFSMVFAGFNALALTSEELQILSDIRNNIFGGSRLAAAFEQTTISGMEPTIFPLEVEDRGLLVWKIDEAQAASFAQEIGLQPPFTLSKVRALTVRGSQTLDAKIRQWLEARGLGQWIDFLYPQEYYVIADIGVTQRAETGAKLEFKTFVQLPGDPTPRLYRFANFKAVPGVELLELSSLAPAALTINAQPDVWSGELLTADGTLSWSVPLRVRPSDGPARPIAAVSRPAGDGDNRFVHFGPATGSVASETGTPDLFFDRRLSEAFLDAGQTVFGPQGVSANYYYDGSSVSGGFLPVRSREVQIQNTFGWSQYLSLKVEALVLDTLTEYLVEPKTIPVQAITTGGPGTCGGPATNSSELFSNLVGCALIGLPPDQVFGQLFQSIGPVVPPQELPVMYYALLDLYQGLNIFQGAERPKLFFSLLEDPSTIFINFEIPRHKVEEFEQEFLPEGFRLAKVLLYPEQRRAVYLVSLNVYQSVGPNISGFRAEWSTYVINPNEEDPKPRFSVLEAQTNVGGFDAVTALERYTTDLDLTDPQDLAQLIEPPSDVFVYTANETDGIQLEVRDFEEQIEVDVSIAYPSPSQILRTLPTTGWMEGNDFVYWGEVADILKYDDNVMFQELLVFEAEVSDTIRDTTFADYVDSDPLPIIIWNGPQKIALEPWGNLNDIQPVD